MPKKNIRFECVFEKDIDRSAQAMEAAFRYLSIIAEKEGWFDGILPNYRQEDRV